MTFPSPASPRYRACLLGGAVGDALGAPVEFLDLTGIRRKFGAGGIRGYAPSFGRLGAITDDTQMTLFTAEGLLRAHVRACMKGIGPAHASVVTAAYLRWLLTQGGKVSASTRLPDREELESGWLFAHRELFARRVPGATCLSALGAVSALGEPAVNNSKGCGGVMRVAPAGLYAFTALGAGRREAFELGVELAGITHGHPTGKVAAGAFAMIIACLAAGRTLPEAMGDVQRELPNHDDFEETFNAIARAARAATSGLSTDAAIRELGEGWVAEEALAIALYCGLVAPTFEEGIVLAVNHDGDSDSTGSIAGNLLGLMHGLEAIPRRWLDDLELRSVIEEVADDLAAFRQWDVSEHEESEESEGIWRKYPGY